MVREMADHVRMLDGGGWQCTHCGERYDMAMPAPLDVYAAAAQAFAASHAGCEARWNPAEPRTVMEWMAAGLDTGISSRTIASVMTRMPCMQGSTMDAPYDAADFGRCARLLRLPFAAGWRARLPEVAAKCPAFAPLIPVWDELDRLFMEADGPPLSKRIRELRGTGGGGITIVVERAAHAPGCETCAVNGCRYGNCGCACHGPNQGPAY